MEDKIPLIRFMKSSFNAANWHVFLISYSLLFLEVLFFKTCIYIHDYLQATFVISYALLGMGIGSVIASRIKKLPIYILQLLLIISIVLSFLNFVLFPVYLFFSPILIAPFALGAIIIAYYLREENAHGIYFYDLIGATLGVFSTLLVLPILREENTFMLLLTVLSLLFFVGSFKKSLFAYLFLLFAAVSFGIGVLHHNNDFLNFAKIVRCQEGMDQKKIFCFKNLRLDGSYGSNIQRIDVIDTKTPYIKYVLYDGLINDHITTHTTANYVFDRRVITGLVDKPNIFIIGTAAEGILRPTVAQQGTVDGVEINKAIMKIMRGPYYDFTKKIYDDIDEFHVADGRSFLKGSTQGKTYDMITLINTHMMRTAGHFGPPEYLHSKEALNEFLNRLSANGYLVFEERNAHEQAEQGVLRIVATIIKALEERGIDNPLDHIFVYDWYGNRSRNRGNLYTNILVKKTPLNDQDWKAINVWAYSLGIYEERKEIIALHPTDVVHPEFQNTEETSSFIPRLNTLLDEYASNGIIPSIIDGVSIEPITDDRPYPWISIESTKLLQRKLLISALVCGGVLLAMLLFFCLFDRSLFRRSMYPFTSYFALLGLGYMIIEIGLLNFYQMFLGSPTYSLVFVLGTLLLSSGIGSLLSGKYSKGKAVIILMSLILLCLYHMLVNRQLISSISSVHALTIILVTLSIVPLGFCMGLPFPYGIEALKKKVSDKYTSLMFGINVVFGAFATMLGMYLSVIVGFQATFFVGILCYIVAFLIFRKWVAN